MTASCMAVPPVMTAPCMTVPPVAPPWQAAPVPGPAAPCPCVSQVPVNPKTKKPYTPEDIKTVIEEEKQKKRQEAEPIAKELNKEFVKKKCERDEQKIKEKVKEIEKVLMHCPECDRIKAEQAAKADKTPKAVAGPTLTPGKASTAATSAPGGASDSQQVPNPSSSTSKAAAANKEIKNDAQKENTEDQPQPVEIMQD